jgi:hypothetical protein
VSNNTYCQVVYTGGIKYCDVLIISQIKFYKQITTLETAAPARRETLPAQREKLLKISRPTSQGTLALLAANT